ncbi:MAG: type IV pilus assembly protein PilB [Parcubacteria group bacterium Athens0714_16]|nr:MAG: type IV pilus assembly protein PilB [Parcubacteria group bacterium Athens0714_16]
MNILNFLNILLNKKLINKEDVILLEKEIKDTGGDVENALMKKGVTMTEIIEAKSEYYKVPFKNLENTPIPFEMLKYIPEKSADYYKIIPLGLQDGELEIGFVNPDDMEARDAVSFIASKNQLTFRVFVISERDFKKVKESYDGLSGEVGKALTELETELSVEEQKLSKEVSEISKKGITTKIIEDAPVTKIVATILRYATEGGASDIHIEPIDEEVRIRFRVDGGMNTSLKLPKKIHNAVVARIKILSNMKLDEKRKPQDGRFSAHVDNRKIDFRVSTFPTYYGEKVVMRILDPNTGVIGLDHLGISEKNLKIIKSAISRSYGLILISGPTGSGKTTTLYSMLEQLDRETNNVLSLENPIEYNIPGVSQSEIRPEIGYTFATGLRTTLRQDPDIIMVGEIRDKDTAKLAIQAALTGHLVLSTIHTNNAVGVIPRLIDMGVDPFLIPPTLIITIAQRLVKLLCPNSGKSIPVDGALKIMIEKQFSDLPAEFKKDIKIPDNVYTIGSSSDCPNGTRGRAAVFEIMEMNKEIEEVILKDPSESAIYKIARKNGMLTMREDALLKAFRGEIPFEEANKL